MKFLPWIIGVKVNTPGFRFPTLWLPVFLLWPFVALFFLLVLTVGLGFALFTPYISPQELLAGSAGIYDLACETRGTKVDLENGKTKVFVAIH
jgi:hypothetical protein